MSRQLEMVNADQIRAAVSAVEAKEVAGELSRADADRRIAECRRAVTPRDLWRASGGLAGARRRQDWWDIRRTVGGLVFLLVLIALMVWLVTWALSLANGNIPGAA